MKKNHAISLLCTALIFGTVATGSSATLFQENFEDANLSGRGWYDNVSPRLSTTEHVANSSRSAEFYFAKGAVTPANTATSMRKKFTATDSVYVSYYIKHSASWVGSGVGYHPHQFYLLTNKDGDWSGLIPTRLTMYIEENSGQSVVSFQDSMNISLANIGKDLTATTESRGVGGCNGDSDGYGIGDCYASGSEYRNGKNLKTTTQLFSNSAGPNYKADWHLVETYIKLNSIVNGKGAKDGIVQQWMDGKQVMNYTGVVLRTGLNADMKFTQFLIGPYIGVGSPVDQTFWIDNLTVGTSRPAQIAPPQNLRVTSK